jgi:hypothetical protein
VDSGWGTVTCETVEVGNRFKGEFEGTTGLLPSQLLHYGQVAEGTRGRAEMFLLFARFSIFNLTPLGNAESHPNQPKFINMTGGLKFSSLIGGNTNM